MTPKYQLPGSNLKQRKCFCNQKVCTCSRRDRAYPVFDLAEYTGGQVKLLDERYLHQDKTTVCFH